MKVSNSILPILFLLIGTSSRLLPHPANIAPIAGMALFGGVYMNKRYALVLPLLAMVLSDLVLGFNGSTPFVYLCFLLTGCIGVWLRAHKSVGNVFLASITSSVLFFLVTNFGFWLAFDLYPKTIAGQLHAYEMGLPFLRNTLLGDFFYTGVFFGGYELVSAIILRKKAGLADA